MFRPEFPKLPNCGITKAPVSNHRSGAGSDNFASRDLSGVNPGFASPPPTAFPYADADIKSGAASPAGKEALRDEIRRKAAVFTARIDDATRAWDQLVTAGAPESEKQQQLLKMAEILSEFSYIRNLERDLEESH